MSQPERCGKARYFWAGVREEVCILPLDHEGKHDTRPSEKEQEEDPRNLSDKEVVSEQRIGEYMVQLLEGPTDNAIRVISGFGHSYTFWIEGVGWKMLARALEKTSGDAFRTETVDRVIKLAQVFADDLDCTAHLALDV